MINYRLSSPSLQDAKSPFSIDKERDAWGGIRWCYSRRAVTRQMPSSGHQQGHGKRRRHQCRTRMCQGRDAAPEMGKEAQHQKVKYIMLTSSTYKCISLTWNDVLRSGGEMWPLLDRRRIFNLERRGESHIRFSEMGRGRPYSYFIRTKDGARHPYPMIHFTLLYCILFRSSGFFFFCCGVKTRKEKRRL